MFNPYSPGNPTYTERPYVSLPSNKPSRQVGFPMFVGTVFFVVLIIVVIAILSTDKEEPAPPPAAPPAVEVSQINQDFTDWWLSRYIADTWQEVAMEGPGRWESNVVYTDVNEVGDTLILVTILSRENSIGQSRAVNAVEDIKNRSAMVTEDEVPESVSNHLRYVVVLDLGDNVLASGGVSFPNVR